MTTTTRKAALILATTAGLFAAWGMAAARADDGPTYSVAQFPGRPTGPTVAAAAPPAGMQFQSGAQNAPPPLVAFRGAISMDPALVDPQPGPSRLRVLPAAQPEPVRPGASIGGSDRGGNRGSEEVDVPWTPIGSATAVIAPPSGELPTDLAAPRFAKEGVVYTPAGESRNWMEYTYCWEASGFCHQPLYFEEVNLERYGYSWGHLQPVASAAHFFGTIPLLPYEMVIQPPCQCVYTLGYYRPGDCGPRQKMHMPFQVDAAAAETAFTIGMVILLH